MPRRGRTLVSGLLLLTALVAAGCARSPAPTPASIEAGRPLAPGVAAASAAPRRVASDGWGWTGPGPAPDGWSASEARRLAAAEAGLVSRGRLRTETAPSDAPWNVDDLVRSFRRIAFYTEFPDGDGPDADRVRLSKWQGVIRWRMQGAGLREGDRTRMQALTDRLEPVTGLRFRELPADATGAADMEIFVLTEGARRAFARGLAAAGKLRHDDLFAIWLRDPRILCFAMTWRDAGRPGAHERRAVIGIRAELPDLWRESCVDEEVVQALGLINDDPGVRPSIFNDDEEFAFMTRHDEALLRMLYDPSLRPGMSEDAAAPLLPRLAARAVAAGR